MLSYSSGQRFIMRIEALYSLLKGSLGIYLTSTLSARFDMKNSGSQYILRYIANLPVQRMCGIIYYLVYIVIFNCSCSYLSKNDVAFRASADSRSYFFVSRGLKLAKV